MASNSAEYQREYMRRYYATHPEYRARQSARGKEWQNAHPGYAHEAYLKRRKRLINGQAEA